MNTQKTGSRNCFEGKYNLKLFLEFTYEGKEDLETTANKFSDSQADCVVREGLSHHGQRTLTHLGLTLQNLTLQ